ncbi:hypothetical protein QOT17_001080 [Balamuthia mandrillaris]
MRKKIMPIESDQKKKKTKKKREGSSYDSKGLCSAFSGPRFFFLWYKCLAAGGAQLFISLFFNGVVFARRTCVDWIFCEFHATTRNTRRKVGSSYER